jgi:hypothetical protein
MYYVFEVVRKTDLVAVLHDMRSWLDDYGCSSAPLAAIKETGDIVSIEVEFSRPDQADAFEKAFQGSGLCPALVSERG